MKNYISIAVFAALLFSCGGKTETAPVAEDTTDVAPTDTATAISEPTEDNVTTESTSEGSEDWDSVLDSYEQFVDEYIDYAKKAANGDMEAVSKYPELMQSATEVSEKLQNAKDELSAEQIARMNKIAAKMANAAQELQ